MNTQINNIIAISCSTERTSLACLHSGSLKSYLNTENLQHSEVVLNELEKLLPPDRLESIQGIAVDIGPGRFIGIRTAVSVAHALALNYNLPVFAISSLQLIAQAALQYNPSKLPIITAIDAQRREWYFAKWQVNHNFDISQPFQENSLTLVEEPTLVRPESHMIKPPAIAVGTGWQEQYLYGAQRHKELLFSKDFDNASDPHSFDYPNATVLAKLAQASQHWQNHLDVKPFYLRDQIAHE